MWSLHSAVLLFLNVQISWLDQVIYSSVSEKIMSIVSEFKEFAMKGSLMDMAVGIIIGAAIGKVVGALVESILMPLIGTAMGGIDFSSLALSIGDASIGYGAFIQALIDFIIVAFVIFMLLRAMNKMKKAEAEEEDAPAEDIVLLTEIRDLLKKQ